MRIFRPNACCAPCQSASCRPNGERAKAAKAAWLFTQFEILELSVVAVPANSGAVIETVAEAAGLSNLKRALRDEPTWMAEMLARARYAAERLANPPRKVVGVVCLTDADYIRAGVKLAR